MSKARVGAWMLLTCFLMALLVLILGIATMNWDLRFVASPELIEFSQGIRLWVALLLALGVFVGWLVLGRHQKAFGRNEDPGQAWWHLPIGCVGLFFLTYAYLDDVIQGPIGVVAAGLSGSVQNGSLERDFVRTQFNSYKGFSWSSWEFQDGYKLFAVDTKLRSLAGPGAKITFVGQKSWAGVQYSAVYIENPNSSDVIVARLAGDDVEVTFE